MSESVMWAIGDDGQVTLTRHEVRRRCDAIIKRLEASGQTVPYTLRRWADNWPDGRDRKRALARLNQPDMASILLALRTDANVN